MREHGRELGVVLSNVHMTIKEIKLVDHLLKKRFSKRIMMP
jgi:hypothetical protein